MAYPLVWPSNPKFCPIGILPATSLTQDLSPEQSADILLLGCGDPRHILYTVSTDVTCPPEPRKLDITCCDLEPAVLARNILLYTLLEDGVPLNQIWDIFHHFRITDHAFGLIKSQSRKLVELSESADVWRQSQYGSFLKMVTAASLVELRDYWTKYAEFSDLPTDRLDTLQKQYDSLSKLMSDRAKMAINYDASRSAANSWKEAAKPVHDQYAHYWTHGTTITSSKELKKVTKLNPTFFYSSLGEDFDVDVNTFPRGYHFAPAFTPLVSDPAGPATGSAIAKAKQQFNAGISAFQMSRKANSITLRFFVGDALALCRALSRYAKTQITDTQEFTSPWRATTIDLAEHAISSPPLAFDIIDASTLGHDLGLFNVLLVSQPLLKKQPASQAVLYTDMPMESRNSIAMFNQKISHSIATPGILAGLVPRPYISLFTSISNTHELIMPRSNPFHVERIPWVDPASGDGHSVAKSDQRTPFVEFRSLMQLVLALYGEFYMYERVKPQEIAIMMQMRPEALEFFSRIQYTREFVIALLAHMRTRLCLTAEGGWDRLTDFLLQAIPQAGGKADIDLVHELGVQCLLHRLPCEKIDAKLGEDVARAGVFKDWIDSPPRVVCVVLKVPHEKLEPLRNKRQGLSPRLICNIVDSSHGKPIKATFEAVQAAWGKCVPLGDSNGDYVIEEGLPGFHGDSQSDLVLTFWANSEKLVTGELTVSLSLLDTPIAQEDYSQELGKDLVLFSARVSDDNHVLVLRNRPTSSSCPQNALRVDAPPAIESEKQCIITIKGSRQDGVQIREMRARVQLESKSDKAALVKGVKGTIKQLGPCTLQVHFRQSAFTIKFPFPILGSLVAVEAHTKTDEIEASAIAQVSSQISVRAGGYPNNWFPVLHHSTLSPWNIHHVHPERLPLIDIRQRDKLAWLVMHTSIQMSDRERIIQRSSHPTERSLDEVLVSVKESLNVLILDYVGLRQGPVRIFALTDTMHGYFCFIFVLGLRLDLAGETVVLDTALVPIHLKGAKEMSPAINILNNSGQALMQLRTRPAEVIAWKHLLPAFVERCRTWPHKPNCEYKAAGKIPLGDKAEVNPLCSCGQGVGLDGPEWEDPAWKAVLPFATRAAISPLFGVSYLEEVAGPAAGMQGVPTSQEGPSDVCWGCNGLRIGRKLQACSKCKKARYCSKECQAKHWKEHKLKCKPA